MFLSYRAILFVLEENRSQVSHSDKNYSRELDGGRLIKSAPIGSCSL